MSLLPSILSEFLLPGELHTVQRQEGGHINDSFKIVAGVGLDERAYLLQRLNPAVFGDPLSVMDNIRVVTAHLTGAVARRGLGQPERRVPQLVATRDGRGFVEDANGGVWRLFRFIEHARSVQQAESVEQAREAGRAFGRFQALLADLDRPLVETIPGFHDTRARFDALERAVAADSAGRLASAAPEVGAILSRREEAEQLERLREAGRLPVRVVHNDAKIANVLFDEKTGEALCVVDLDTVMPGIALHDLGDLVRSTAADAPEDEPDVRRVRVRAPFVAAVTEGYLQEAREFLVPAELDHLHQAAPVIILEQAARFLSDYLEGDKYYPVSRPWQNLDRARTQFAIYEGVKALG